MACARYRRAPARRSDRRLPGEGVERFAAGFDARRTRAPRKFRWGSSSGCAARRSRDTRRRSTCASTPRPRTRSLSTDRIDFCTLRRLERFALLWDRVANSGNFLASAPLLWGEGSPFWAFLRFTDWMYEELGRVHGVALDRIVERMAEYLEKQLGYDREGCAPRWHRTTPAAAAPSCRACCAPPEPTCRCASREPPGSRGGKHDTWGGRSRRMRRVPPGREPIEGRGSGRGHERPRVVPGKGFEPPWLGAGARACAGAGLSRPCPGAVRHQAWVCVRRSTSVLARRASGQTRVPKPDEVHRGGLTADDQNAVTSRAAPSLWTQCHQ